MRNPKWHRDEIILALDLYFKIEKRQIHSNNPKIVELSALLNRLPIFDEKPDSERFRNPNGVSLKLSNFLAIDNTHTGQGMSSFSKLDKEIFHEFDNDRTSLSNIANAIRNTLQKPFIIEQLNHIFEDPESKYLSAKEGQVLFKLHKYRERNQTIVKKKKNLHLKTFGKLICELCDFDFENTYGEVGRGFIECHHKTPLSELDVNSETKLDDLLLVCSNCHRMLHRGMQI